MTEILSIYWNVNPELIHIGGFAIRWYSLLFVAGFILGWFIFQWFFNKESLNPKLLDSLLVTLIVGTIIGARLGHCFFYQPDYYLAPFVKMFGGTVSPDLAREGLTEWEGFFRIFMPWKGGLASHGGTIALFIAMIWYAKRYGRKHHFDFVWLLDHLCIAVAFAAMFIRLGNFFNSEIYGGTTNLPWGVVFARAGESEPRHPTQLYEALSYLLLGLFLLWRYKTRLKQAWKGSFIGIFFIVCFGSRFLIEFIKEDQVEFEASMALNMGQLLSIPFILLGIGFLVYAYKNREPSFTNGGYDRLRDINRKR